jgi:1-deoxy-D-xylulose-5-phosphate synthase
LYTAQLGLKLPIAIRYPRGRGVEKEWEAPFEEMTIGKGKCLRKGNKVAVLSIGSMTTNVKKAIQRLTTENPSHYDMLFVKPLDETLLHKVFKQYETILTVEDGVVTGGFGSAILEFAARHNYKLKIRVLGIPDEFIEQGNIGELQEIAKINVGNIREEIASLFLNL